MSGLKTTLLAATLLTAGLGGAAYAQMGSTYDPAQLPTIKGKVAQYLPTPRGDVDGFVLDDGTEVHVSPRMSTQLVFAVKPGDAVTIHGLKARAIAMVAAASITNDASNVTIEEGGMRHGHEESPISAQGKIKIVLHGMRGETNGVLLEDGTVVHMPPPEAERLGDQLAVGKTLAVEGNGVSGPLGKSIAAREIGADDTHLVKISGPRPGFFERWSHEGHWGHGPGPMDGPGPKAGDAPPPPPPPQ